MSILNNPQSQVNELGLKQNEWVKIKFGDIAEEVKNRVDVPSESGYERFVGGDHLDSGDLYIKRWGSTKDVNAQKLLFKKGHVLFGKRNAYLRKVAYADFDGVCSAHMMVLKPRIENIEECFFPHFMQSDQFWQRALMISEGSMSPTIKWKVLEKQEFLVPPKNEQRRIAAILWAVEDVIVKNEQFVAEVEHYKQLMMRELFHKGIGHSEFKKVKKIGVVPKDWDVNPLSDVAEIKSGVTLGRKLNGKSIRLPYLRVANVKDGYLDLSEIKEIDILESEKEKWLLKKDDILVTEGGDWDKVGRGTIWRGEIPNCIHQNHIFSVRVSTNKLLPIYLSYLFSSPYGKKYFQLASKQTTNLASINQKQLKSFIVMIPPLIEQSNIVSILSSIDETVNSVQNAIESTRALKMKLINTLLSPAEGDGN